MYLDGGVMSPIELGSIRRVDDDYFEVSASQWCPRCKHKHWSVTLLSTGLLSDPECISEVSEVKDSI